ncbi:hypothetical protein CF319_g1406 [Tilletia indica]|uniref:Major facilitator superfamily (MFS) profile domain-containing protein n=1 Tax=Tilletia indica TaxID=43049 RepID=A0A177T9B1_9BASI|nr:hypothetical protein CF319_g1406 [Tilletia indica]KAE8254530.1 hypothetical protein A4X13_0g3385 [Tilletia indica]
MADKGGPPEYAAVADQHLNAIQEVGHQRADAHTIQPFDDGTDINSHSPISNEKEIIQQPHPTHDEEGRPYPSEAEIATLRRVPASIPVSAFLVALLELAERLSYYGAVQVFQNFVQRPLPDCSTTGASACAGPNASSGALGYGQRAATAISNTNNFWVYIMPILGAWIADSRLGRFKTVCWAVLIAIVGHVLLVISALPSVISDRAGSMACFCVAFVVMGVGTGWFKSSISPLMAEQVASKKMFVNTLKSGERVIVDPSLTLVRLFMYFYLFINIGALIGQVAMPFAEKHVGYWLAYLVPTIVFALCPIVLFVGRNMYRSVPPSGSVLARSLRLWWFAARGRWSWNPIRTWKQLRADDFWTNVLPSKQKNPPKWMNFDDGWVYEVRRGYKACAVFCLYPVFWLCYQQINNNLVSQSAVMTLNGVPNEIISNTDPLALLILIPFMDIVFYPFLRRCGINFTALKRITAGFIAASLSMVWAAVLQHYIYQTNPCGKYVSTCEDADGNPIVSSLNVWIQTGIYVLVALSEIFASITGLEYAFTKAPTNMRSLVTSAFLFTNAVASAIGQAFVPLSEDPNLVINYAVFGVAAFIFGIIFWLIFRDLDAQEDALNQLDEGQYGSRQPDLEEREMSSTHHGSAEGLGEKKVGSSAASAEESEKKAEKA